MQKANVRSLGPYLRYGIWFYGCDKNCLGCIYHENEPLSFESVSIDSILQKILSNKDIEGVTISGGEPFLQNDLRRLRLPIRSREHRPLPLHR